MLTGIKTVDGFLWFGKLHHRFLQIVKSPLCQHMVFLVKMKQVIPNGLFGQYFGIANDDNSVACASHGYVQPTWIIKKTDSLIFVGADTRHDYNILLSTLESVNASNFNILKWNEWVVNIEHVAPRSFKSPTCYLIQFSVQWSLMLHVLNEIRTLSLVGCDYSNLLWFDTRAQKTCGDLFNIGCFRSVQVGCARTSYFFLAQRNVEKHGSIWHGPREVHAAKDTVLGTHTVLQRTFVEEIGGKLGKAWVHTILHFQTERPDSKYYKALKQGLRKASFSGWFTHHYWAQLAMITDEDELNKWKVNTDIETTKLTVIPVLHPKQREPCTRVRWPALIRRSG